LWGKLDALEELGDEMAIELERLHRTLKQMREDFRRIEMMAGQHSAASLQISATI
jgi:hypothetical protein